MWIKGTLSDTLINLDKCSHIDFIKTTRGIRVRFYANEEKVGVISLPRGTTEEDFIQSIMKASPVCQYYEVEEG